MLHWKSEFEHLQATLFDPCSICCVFIFISMLRSVYRNKEYIGINTPGVKTLSFFSSNLNDITESVQLLMIKKINQMTALLNYFL